MAGVSQRDDCGGKMSRKITKDGRTILSGKDYTAFRQAIYVAQNSLCGYCRRTTSLTVDIECDWSFQVDHTRGRGGGRRDDTYEACSGVCGGCHRRKHNQQSAVPSELKWSRA